MGSPERLGLGVSPWPWVAFQPRKPLRLSRGTRCITRLGDLAWVMVAAAVVKTGLGTALECSVFEENQLHQDAFHKPCLQGTLLCLPQTVSVSR